MRDINERINRDGAIKYHKGFEKKNKWYYDEKGNEKGTNYEEVISENIYLARMIQGK